MTFKFVGKIALIEKIIPPSNPRLPPIEPLIPKVAFESIVCSYFNFE